MESELMIELFKPDIFCAGIKEKYAVQKSGTPMLQLFGGEEVFGTTSTLTNIHSHYVGTGSNTFSGYIYTGRMMITGSSGIGVTFFSQYPGQEAYYRLRRHSDDAFHISPHGTSVTGDIDIGVIPAPNVWYWFKVQVEDTGTLTEIRAKVWADGSSEPTDWQVDCSFDCW